MVIKTEIKPEIKMNKSKMMKNRKTKMIRSNNQTDIVITMQRISLTMINNSNNRLKRRNNHN